MSHSLWRRAVGSGLVAGTFIRTRSRCGGGPWGRGGWTRPPGIDPPRYILVLLVPVDTSTRSAASSHEGPSILLVGNIFLHLIVVFEMHPGPLTRCGWTQVPIHKVGVKKELTPGHQFIVARGEFGIELAHGRGRVVAEIGNGDVVRVCLLLGRWVTRQGLLDGRRTRGVYHLEILALSRVHAL